MRPYLALTGITLKLAMREKAVLFFNFVLPMAFLFGFGQLMRADSGGISMVVTMVLVFGVLGSGLYGAGLRAVSERESNILRRYKVAPISPAPLLVASMAAGVVLYLPTLTLILVAAHFRYGMGLPQQWLSLYLFVSIGAIAMRSIGLIIASVANSVAESNILIQLTYLPMLFLSGATVPLSLYPQWLQTVAQFIPASHLFTGLHSILLKHESLLDNVVPAGALLLSTAIATFVSAKLFRWEKEQKIPGRAKLWVIAAFLPFVLLGVYQAKSHDNIKRNEMLERTIRRSRTRLVRGATVFAGDGTVLKGASILIEKGKIAEIFTGIPPDAKALKAEAYEAFGKTVLPGLIDLSPVIEGNLFPAERVLADYLYCGVTAVAAKNPGEALKALQQKIASGEASGAEVFAIAVPDPPRPALMPASAFDNPLVQQVIPPQILGRLRGSGVPALPVPGAALQWSLEERVKAGEAPAKVLRSVTGEAAARLRAGDRIGLVRKGYDATLFIVEGNPLEDISATQRISDLFFQGEHVDRGDLLEKP
jgi:ABC-type multidrug transport system permease subunit